MTARGLTHAQAIEYTGVKRRTFDQVWRPRLNAMRQGSCLLFDRQQIDVLFEQFMNDQPAHSQPEPQAATDEVLAAAADSGQNEPRNGRLISNKGEKKWANKHGVFTPKKTEPGKSTSGTESLGFAAAALAVLKRQNGG